MNVEPANFSDFAESADTPSQDTQPTSDGLTPDDASAEIVSVDDLDNSTSVSEPDEALMEALLEDLQKTLSVAPSAGAQAIVRRIAVEVERICEKSDRIQSSGQISTWKMTLAQHRLQKILAYYKLGSRRGRVELHSHLSAIVYRHISRSRAQLGFQGRYGLIEDFLQGFYIEVLKAFRKENNLPEDYSPRSRLELSEYMAFSEQYAKRRINLPGRRNQQLIVLRAQGFAKRQPEEASVDIELAVESGKGEEAEAHSRSPVVQQVREQMVADAVDPSDSVLRDRVIGELIQYLQSQDQQDCVNYLVLKLQDLSAPEIDDILNLSPRQRDYLQQRFKYHVEKFARSQRWQLVHQWLGADLDQNLGMPPQKWAAFLETLQPEQRQLVQLKSTNAADQAIAKTLRCTPKQVHKRWVKVLELAWQFRNQEG
ncbi:MULTISPECIES: HetZ-related protein [unclassified Leptolyngbya]|uniref:HetZ-related protein n=1 Tax=unclassified Leptolyngbya TaxID=2650499 RepID=UPI001683A9A3|nr:MULTISPECIES: HetZ-related protein [unclassified Leptolyngbya]MBD1910168.1 HetZ-related protein [Leptolyngbya sp. FACHB-8]MBD2153600.1 HetZ-related protein [Leptolyngbya sp. FACHB-16]